MSLGHHFKAVLAGVAFIALGWGSLGAAEDPEEEEEPREWREADQYLRFDIGFTFHDISFFSDASSEFQRIAYGKKERYELRVDLGFINKFDDQAITFLFGGSYHPWRPLRLSVDAGFSPSTIVAPRQQYAFRAEQTVWERLTAGLSYRFQDFNQANLHRAGPLIGLKLHDRLRLSGFYELSDRFAPGRASAINHGAAIRADAKLLSVLWLWGSYGRSSHDFEPAAPDDPFKSYTSHDIGAGLRFEYLMGNGLFFDFGAEERDNDQSIRTYTIGSFLNF